MTIIKNHNPTHCLPLNVLCSGLAIKNGPSEVESAAHATSAQSVVFSQLFANHRRTTIFSFSSFDEITVLFLINSYLRYRQTVVS